MKQQSQTAHQKINRKGLYGIISQKNCTLKHQKKKRSIKWKDFNELQTNKIENINVEIENLLSNIEDTFINTAGKVLKKQENIRKARPKIGKLEIKNGLAKLVMTNIKS